MSLRILKAGILDSIQDMGRFGFQHQGINPTGAMDKFAASVANTLVGNTSTEAVLELHFPASDLLFDQPAIIALTGADFNATINGEPVPVNQPLLINKSSILQFHSRKEKARCYLAIHGGFNIGKWLNSFSTNLKAEAGGVEGRKLKKDDLIELTSKLNFQKSISDDDFKILPWKTNQAWDDDEGKEILILHGNEWDWLDKRSQQLLLSDSFAITGNSDRMGYRLKGELLQTISKEELVSSAICFGTIQLLPDGQLIILMADHQTTGGYPRVANIISAHLPRLAQMNAGEKINFRMTDQATAENLLIKQKLHLLQLQNACKLRLENFIHEIN